MYIPIEVSGFSLLRCLQDANSGGENIIPGHFMYQVVNCVMVLFNHHLSPRFSQLQDAFSSYIPNDVLVVYIVSGARLAQMGLVTPCVSMKTIIALCFFLVICILFYWFLGVKIQFTINLRLLLV